MADERIDSGVAVVETDVDDVSIEGLVELVNESDQDVDDVFTQPNPIKSPEKAVKRKSSSVKKSKKAKKSKKRLEGEGRCMYFLLLKFYALLGFVLVWSSVNYFFLIIYFVFEGEEVGPLSFADDDDDNFFDNYVPSQAPQMSRGEK